MNIKHQVEVPFKSSVGHSVKFQTVPTASFFQPASAPLSIIALPGVAWENCAEAGGAWPLDRRGNNAPGL